MKEFIPSFPPSLFFPSSAGNQTVAFLHARLVLYDRSAFSFSSILLMSKLSLIGLSSLKNRIIILSLINFWIKPDWLSIDIQNLPPTGARTSFKCTRRGGMAKQR